MSLHYFNIWMWLQTYYTCSLPENQSIFVNRSSHQPFGLHTWSFSCYRNTKYGVTIILVVAHHIKANIVSIVTGITMCVFCLASPSIVPQHIAMYCMQKQKNSQQQIFAANEIRIQDWCCRIDSKLYYCYHGFYQAFRCINIHFLLSPSSQK